jgi:hypothetical protein
MLCALAFFQGHVFVYNIQKDFWPTIKPFITNKGSYFENNIILTDDDRIINDQNEVAETFNEFFVNVATMCNSVEVVKNM